MRKISYCKTNTRYISCQTHFLSLTFNTEERYVQREGERDSFLLPYLHTAKEEVLPKGDPFLSKDREVGQLGLLEKHLSTDKDRGSIYSKFR